MSLSFLLHLALADYRERTRRFGFLLTLGITLWAAYMFLPPNDSQYTTMRLGLYRGLYNSAWVGTLVALLTTLFLGLAGFYLIKNSLERDYRTRVGELLAATRVTSGRYLLAKMLSNLAVLVSILGVIVVAAGATQIIRSESTHIEPLKLCLPFLLITLPMMAFVAAVGVLFETVRWLRGGLGNVVYYFLWSAILMTGMLGANNSSGLLDPAGVQVTMNQIRADFERVNPDFDPEHDGVALGINIQSEGQRLHLSTFEWQGATWSITQLAARLLWFGLSFGLLLPARWLFDRYSFANPSGGGTRRKPAANADLAAEDAERIVAIEPASAGHLRPGSFFSNATGSGGHWRFGGLVAAELKLALKGTSVWWYIVALGLIPACLFVPLGIVRSMFFPLAWIWPILKWSPLGTRELQNGTDQLLYSAPAPVWRQLPATWLAGVLIAVATGSGMALRLILAGDLAGLDGWLVGALFIPTFALFLGNTSGSSKLFEILYLILWYGGPLNAVRLLDYMGATSEAVQTGVPARFLVVAVLLAAGAVVARSLRLRK